MNKVDFEYSCIIFEKTKKKRRRCDDKLATGLLSIFGHFLKDRLNEANQFMKIFPNYLCDLVHECAMFSWMLLIRLADTDLWFLNN